MTSPKPPSVAFGNADVETMSLIALVARVGSIKTPLPSTSDASHRDDVHNSCDALMRRLCDDSSNNANNSTATTAKRPGSKQGPAFKFPSDAVKFKVIDKIAQGAPHLAIRPIHELLPAGGGSDQPSGSSTQPSSVHLAVVLDVSGSMRHVILQYQRALKRWLESVKDDYASVTLIFFSTNVKGCFVDDLSQLDRGDWCGGYTYAKGALNQVRQVSAQNRAKNGGLTDVLFCTDGQFTTNDSGRLDTTYAAYSIPVLPDVVRFTMLFPEHTPADATSLHYNHLPRVTPAGIPISCNLCPNATDLGTILTKEMSSTSHRVFAASKMLQDCPILTAIGGEYAMLNGMSLFQMNKIIDDLLAYPDEHHMLVHNFFSHVMGMYHVMMNKSGDLLNTLRSEEMRLMWGLLQPLKKRFQNVPEDNIHFCTTSMVLEFLEGFETQLCDLRDKRLNELKALIDNKTLTTTTARADELKKEMEDIRKAFNNMKKVDEYDRIMAQIQDLKKPKKMKKMINNIDKNKEDGGSNADEAKAKAATDDQEVVLLPPPLVLRVRFNYIAKEVPLEFFKAYPNISKDDRQEIYKMIASLTVVGVAGTKSENATTNNSTATSDDDYVFDLVCDARCQGLVNVLRLLTFRPSDDVRMTLTATQVTRILLGFYTSQFILSDTAGGYVCSPDHLKVKHMIWTYCNNPSATASSPYVSSTISPAILGNITNMEEPVNQSPEWIKILCTVASWGGAVIPIFPPAAKKSEDENGQNEKKESTSFQPPDMSLWTFSDAVHEKGIKFLVLNSEKLQQMVDANNALVLVRSVVGLGNAARTVRISTTIELDDATCFGDEAAKGYLNAIQVKRVGRNKSMEEWRDEVIRVETYGDEKVQVTNGMDLQSKLNISVDTFLNQYYDAGHRLIQRSGGSHPATMLAATQPTVVREAIQEWIRGAWAAYKAVNGLAEEDKSLYPTVPTAELAKKIATAFAIRASTNGGPSYAKESSETVEIADIFDFLLAQGVDRDAKKNEVLALSKAICEHESFSASMKGEDQQVLATEIATTASSANAVTTTGQLVEKAKKHPQIATAVEGIATTLAEKMEKMFGAHEAVVGIGSSTASSVRQARAMRLSKRRTVNEWEELLSNAHEGLLFDAKNTLDDGKGDDVNALCEEDFTCPLSGEIFNDPVAFGGHIYERTWIEMWLRRDPRRSSPLTRATTEEDGVTPLELKDVSPLFAEQLKRFVDARSS